MLTQVAQANAEHGCRRLYYDYERDAIDGDEFMNFKAFRRIYRLAGLQIGRRRRRGRAKIVRGRSLRRATKPFEGWTLDFIHDRLFNGRSLRGLTMMDEFIRVELAHELNYSFTSKSVISVLDDVSREFGYPKHVRLDNRTELMSKIMQACPKRRRARREAPLHSTRQADAERLHRVVQLSRSRGVPQRALVSSAVLGANGSPRMAPCLSHHARP